MIINPRDNTIVISEVTNFPTVTLQNGVIIYFEVQNTNNLQIDKRSKIKVNVSKRDRNGSFVKGGNYVNQGVLYSLNNQSNPQAKRRLSPNLFEAVQKMHQGDIGWILLNPQNDASVDKDIFVRIEVIDVEQIKISFPELPYQEQLEMIEEYKKKADALFLEALNIDDETIRNENLKKSYEEYKQGATYFLQIPKKKVKLFDKQTATNHYDFGAKIYNNYCKCMYKLKMNEQALEQIGIFEKILRQKKMPFLLKILKTKAIIYQKTKNDKLNETVEEILQQEQNPSEIKFYQNMIKPVIKENPKVNKAFYKALRNAEKEDYRESVMKKVDLNIEFAELNVQENENQVIIDSSDDEEESFEVANDDEKSA